MSRPGRSPPCPEASVHLGGSSAEGGRAGPGPPPPCAAPANKLNPQNSALSPRPHAPPPPPGRPPNTCTAGHPLLSSVNLPTLARLTSCSVKKVLEPVSPHRLCRPGGICGCSCPLGMHWGCSTPRSPTSALVCGAGLPAHCPCPHAVGLQGPPTGLSTQGPDKSPVVRARDGAPWGSGPDRPGLSGARGCGLSSPFTSLTTQTLGEGVAFHLGFATWAK